MTSLDLNCFGADMKKRSAQLSKYIKRDAPRILAIEANKHFKNSFERGGFTDNYFTPWKPAKRTNPSSQWYGFSYGAKSAMPEDHPRRRGTKRKYKARKSNPTTNYSPTATTRSTLVGSRNLMDSIKYNIGRGKVTFRSNLPYAQVHNEGGTIKIFGGKTVKVSQRRFMGPSMKLNAKVKQTYNKDIHSILK